MRNAGSLSAGFFLPAICAWATSLTVRPDVRACGALWQGRAIVNRE
ncbi:hypothetical protein SMATCC274_26400 [Serratia marcescens]|nr:hypothetical protein SMATCC274_26400 [Serratia marcescens]